MGTEQPPLGGAGVGEWKSPRQEGLCSSLVGGPRGLNKPHVVRLT